jgi:hypothetical protein
MTVSETVLHIPIRGISLILAIISLLSGSGYGQIHKYELLQYNDPQVKDFSEPQYYNEWCWAACIAMSFKSQKVELNQDDIVKYIKHEIVNQGATPSEIVATLMDNQGIDQNHNFYNAKGLLIKRTSPTTFDAAGHILPADGMGALLAFYLAHGVPALMIYLNPDGQTEHCVFLGGITLAQAGEDVITQSYQVEDPWPVDAAGQPTRDGRAVRKSLNASQFRSVRALIIPLVFSSYSIDEMQTFYTDMQDFLSNIPRTISEMDARMTKRIKITDVSTKAR